MAPCWEVVGGADKGGILVRSGKELASAALAERLSTGAQVQQLELAGDRLHYKLLSGAGPQEGWVSLKVGGKDLLVEKGASTDAPAASTTSAPAASTAGKDAPAAEAPAAVPAGSGAAAGEKAEEKDAIEGDRYRVRLAVNIDEWAPEGDFQGREFQFLLNLVAEEEERKAVLRFKFLEDKKRALLSRLLTRSACARMLQRSSFKGVAVQRTKGRKPFLASPLPPVEEAPNFNINVSHEGSWVVCAAEPLCVTGIDVAELRRHNKKGEAIDFRESFDDQLTAAEWRDVESAGADLDAQYEVFSRYWSAKEAFVKARGDGLAFPLGKVEFRWTPLEGFPERSAYRGTALVEGKAQPQWRFVQHRMPGEKAHWTTVARGPIGDIVDAHGEFTKTLRRPMSKFSEAEWEAALAAPSPPCQVVPVGALVPKDDMDDYVKAGGTRWP